MKFVGVFAILTILVCSFSAFSQQATATLIGVVSDPNGAVISGATVTVTNKGTSLSRTVATNDEGVYVFANLPVGDYEVKMSATNFETKVTESLVSLKVGQTVTLNGESLVLKRIILIEPC